MEPTESNAGKIYQAMTAIMKAIGPIAKGRKNEQQNYQFRGIDDVYNEVQTHMAENGVFVVPVVLRATREVLERQGKGALLYTILRVRHRFYADDGSYVDAVTVGEAMDSGDKSANKAMSAAMKYALIESFCIPTKEMKDTENETHEANFKTSNVQQRTSGTAQQKPSPTSAPVANGAAGAPTAALVDPKSDRFKFMVGLINERWKTQGADTLAGINRILGRSLEANNLLPSSAKLTNADMERAIELISNGAMPAASTSAEQALDHATAAAMGGTNGWPTAAPLN